MLAERAESRLSSFSYRLGVISFLDRKISKRFMGDAVLVGFLQRICIFRRLIFSVSLSFLDDFPVSVSIHLNNTKLCSRHRPANKWVLTARKAIVTYLARHTRWQHEFMAYLYHIRIISSRIDMQCLICTTIAAIIR